MALQLHLGNLLKGLRTLTTAQTDLRVKLTAEVIGGALTIKASAWEQPFLEQVQSLRQKEEALILRSQRLKGVNRAFYFSTTTLAGLATFVVYVYGTGGTLTLGKSATVVASLQVLRLVIGKHLARFTSVAPEALVAVQRMQKVLEAPEIASSSSERHHQGLSALQPASDDFLVKLDKASFQWADVPTLTDVDLTVKSGELVMLSGCVGCGKSSLLSSLLGEVVLHIIVEKELASITYKAAWHT